MLLKNYCWQNFLCKKKKKKISLSGFPMKTGLVVPVHSSAEWDPNLGLRTLADPRLSACWFGLGGDQVFSSSEMATLLVWSGPHFCLVCLFVFDTATLHQSCGSVCCAVFVTGSEVKPLTFHYIVRKGIYVLSAAGWNSIHFTVSVRTWTIWGTLIYLHLNKGVCVK